MYFFTPEGIFFFFKGIAKVFFVSIEGEIHIVWEPSTTRYFFFSRIFFFETLPFYSRNCTLTQGQEVYPLTPEYCILDSIRNFILSFKDLEV
jgi:hypothetical protein